MQLGFPYPAGGIDPGELFFHPDVVVVDVWKDFLSGDGNHPPQGALALCTIPSQSAIGQWCWGFHTMRSGFEPRDHRFGPQVVVNCKGMDAFLIRACEPVLPGVRWYTYDPQPLSDRPVGLGFHRVRGGFQPRDHQSRPWVAGVVDCGGIFDPGMGSYRPWLAPA